MRKKQDIAIQELKDKFNELSEDWWSAGWCINVEFYLYEDLKALLGGEEPENRQHPAYYRELKELDKISERAGGWLFWDEKKEGTIEDPETFITWKDWNVSNPDSPQHLWIKLKKEWQEEQ